jgi:hypothetical protein
MAAVVLSILAMTGCASVVDPVDNLVSTSLRDEPRAAAAPVNPNLVAALGRTGEAELLMSADPAAVQPSADGLQLQQQTMTPDAGVTFRIGEGAPRVNASFDNEFYSVGTDRPRPLEISLAAAAPWNLDVGVAHRSLGEDGPGGRLAGRGSEVRIGQGLARLAPTRVPSSRPSWYFFAASDGRALTWTPTSDPADPNRALRLQDRVEIGDLMAGLSMETHGLQASLGYVKRNVKTQIGPFKKSIDASFAGVTLTWKR